MEATQSCTIMPCIYTACSLRAGLPLHPPVLGQVPVEDAFDGGTLLNMSVNTVEGCTINLFRLEIPLGSKIACKSSTNQ